VSDLNFNYLFGDRTIDCTCPNCKTEIAITLRDAEKTITCPICGAEIELQQDETFDKSIDEINNLSK